MNPEQTVILSVLGAALIVGAAAGALIAGIHGLATSERRGR